MDPNVIYAWALGMMSTVPILVLIFRVLPWLSGWRNITYNIFWTDENKRFWIFRQVKWKEWTNANR